MAGDKSGDGKTSPYKGASDGKGNNFLKNPGGAGGGKGNDFIANPDAGQNKSGGNNFVKNPAGDTMSMDQKKGVYRNPTSVPAGGPTPFVKGGAQPAPSRQGTKNGLSADPGPTGPSHKPFKVSSK